MESNHQVPQAEQQGNSLPRLPVSSPHNESPNQVGLA